MLQRVLCRCVERQNCLRIHWRHLSATVLTCPKQDETRDRSFSGAFDASERAVFIFVLAFHSAMTLRNVAVTLHAGRCVCLMYYAVRILFFQHWIGVVWSSNRPKSNHTGAAAVLEQGAADVEV